MSDGVLFEALLGLVGGVSWTSDECSGSNLSWPEFLRSKLTWPEFLRCKLSWPGFSRAGPDFQELA